MGKNFFSLLTLVPLEFHAMDMCYIDTFLKQPCLNNCDFVCVPSHCFSTWGRWSSPFSRHETCSHHGWSRWHGRQWGQGRNSGNKITVFLKFYCWFLFFKKNIFKELIIMLWYLRQFRHVAEEVLKPKIHTLGGILLFFYKLFLCCKFSFQELIGLIKHTKIPIICMCNDRNHPKIRSLVHYCFDLRFQRPRVEQIKVW